MNNTSLWKNASWIVFGKIGQSILGFLIGMISARYLGPSNYGLISYASSLVMFATPIVQLGLRNTLVEELISHPECEGKTLGTTLAMTLVSSVFGMIGIASFVAIANAGERDTLLVCCLYSISLFFQMTEMVQYWFQAKMLSKYTSLVSLAAYAVVSCYKLFLLIRQKSVYWFALSSALDYLLVSGFLLVLYYKIGNQPLRVCLSWGRRLFNKSKYYIVSGIMVMVFSQTDRIMIKMFLGDAENGFYSAAITCAGMASFVFQAIIDSFRPVIFESRKQEKEIFEKHIVRLYSIVLYLGLLQSCFFTLFAPVIVPITYGKAYKEAVPLLQIITWYSSFSYMGSVRNIWILSKGVQRYLWVINLSGAVLNVLGNALLIPLIGTEGAAIATVVTQIFTNFILCFLISPIRPTADFIVRALDPRVLVEMATGWMRGYKTKS